MYTYVYTYICVCIYIYIYQTIIIIILFLLLLIIKAGARQPRARSAAALEGPGRRSAASAATPAASSGAPARPEVGPDLVEALRREAWHSGQIVHVARVPSRAARLARPRASLDPRLADALSEFLGGGGGGCGADLLIYTHQAAAIDAALGGRDVVVSTSTGSGKSLVYLAVVFEALLRDAAATALFVFPTKAYNIL